MALAENMDKTIVRAPVLRKGDTVGIIAPATPAYDQSSFELIFHWLDKLGLKHKLGKHIYDVYSDYAGCDEARLKDFHDMWSDPTVKAILPVRGGNGALRLLPGLDFELIAKHPKLLIGYSDITALLIAIHQRTGMVTFHGPMAISFFDSSYTYNHFIMALMQAKPLGLITDPVDDDTWGSDRLPPRVVIAKGKAKGRLTGGNMTLVRQLMGTPYEMETKGKIIFLEDICEEPHSIDMRITQLLLAGKLQESAGIIIGECFKCEPGGSNRRSFELNYSLETMLRERLGDLGIPVVYGLRFGHTKNRLTLPIGVMASLDVTDNGVRFKIEEKATV